MARLAAAIGMGVLVALMSNCPARAQSAAAPAVFNYRGDGTGLFPKAQPVTEWGRWPKSPTWGLRGQAKKPSDGDAGEKAAAITDGQILDWLVVGPFTAKDPAKLLDEEFIAGEDKLSPDEGAKAGDLEWKPFKAPAQLSSVEAVVPFINFGKFDGKTFTTAMYAHAYLYSQSKGTIVFQMDQQGPARIWINGKDVHNSAKPVMATPGLNYVCYASGEHWAGEFPIYGAGGCQRIKVDLEKGWNRVLIKTAGVINLRLVELPDVQYEGKNILWTCPLPSFGNAQPIMVGDRLFVMSESEDLLCVDKNTGKVLWKKSLFYADCLTDAEKKANPLFQQAADLTEKLRDTTDPIQRVVIRNQIKKAFKDAEEKIRTDDPMFADIRALQAKLAAKDATPEQKKELLGKIRSALEKLDLPKERNVFHMAVLPLERVAADPQTKEADRAGILKRLDDVLATAAPMPRFQHHPGSHVGGTGWTCNTPVSDGQRVYVLTGWGVVGCFDLDGNRKWINLITDLGDSHAYNISTPILVGQKLIMVRGAQVRAMDKASGKVLWTTPDLRPKIGVDVWHGYGTGTSYSSSPAALKIGDKDVVFFYSALVDADSGKVYSQMVEQLDNSRSIPVVSGDTLFLTNVTDISHFTLPAAVSDNMRMAHFRKGTYEGGVDTYSGPLIHDGLVYSVRANGHLWVQDAKTLAPVYDHMLDMAPYYDYDHPGVTPALSLAGKFIYAFDNQGTCVVFEPGRQFKQVARNRIATCVTRVWAYDPDEMFQSAPVFDGKRMYLRGEANLYCIGEK